MFRFASSRVRLVPLALLALVALVAACAPAAQPAPTPAPTTAPAKPASTTAPAASPAAAASPVAKPSPAASPAAVVPSPAAAAKPASALKPSDFPTKAITAITGSSPGGGMDVFSRQLAEGMRSSFPQPVVVENRSGAGGANSLNETSKRPADGYTLVTTTAGTCILTPYLQDAPLKCDSFDPVARIQGEDYFLFVRDDSPYKTIDDFVKDAKTRRTKIAGAWFGTLDSFVPFVFAQEAGFEFDYVPFEGSGDALTQLLGGNVDLLSSNVSEVAGQFEAKKIRMLAVTTAERNPDFRDVPTLKEKGWNVDVVQWRGFMAPKGTPKDRREYLAASFREAMQSNVWQQFVQSSKSKDYFQGPDEFGAFMQQEAQRWIGLMDRYGMKEKAQR